MKHVLEHINMYDTDKNNSFSKSEFFECVQLQSPNRDLGWDEADFEFLGTNSTAHYKIHTNLITNGIGGREQQFFFPFDPTANFHTYSFFWTPQQIM